MLEFKFRYFFKITKIVNLNKYQLIFLFLYYNI